MYMPIMPGLIAGYCGAVWGRMVATAISGAPRRSSRHHWGTCARHQPRPSRERDGGKAEQQRAGADDEGPVARRRHVDAKLVRLRVVVDDILDVLGQVQVNPRRLSASGVGSTPRLEGGGGDD